MSGITLEGISKSFGAKRVLADFTLELPGSGVVCLSGPSGSGKSTLLGVISGTFLPDSGSVSGLEGRSVSMVFQTDRLLPWLTAYENAAAVSRLTEGELRDLFDAAGLSAEDAGKHPAALSGGMRRRAAIVRALAHQGDILLLDEPFSGLDRGAAAALSELILRTMAGGLTILVSHSAHDLAAFGGRILCFDGPPLRLLDKLSGGGSGDA